MSISCSANGSGKRTSSTVRSRCALGEVAVRVPRLADLILLKLAAGGSLDLHDAAVLLTLGDRDVLAREIEERLPEVRPDVSHRWRELLAGR
jgi:hypothetical protein